MKPRASIFGFQVWFGAQLGRLCKLPNYSQYGIMQMRFLRTSSERRQNTGQFQADGGNKGKAFPSFILSRESQFNAQLPSSQLEGNSTHNCHGYTRQLGPACNKNKNYFVKKYAMATHKFFHRVPIRSISLSRKHHCGVGNNGNHLQTSFD